MVSVQKQVEGYVDVLLGFFFNVGKFDNNVKNYTINSDLLFFSALVH